MSIATFDPPLNLEAFQYESLMSTGATRSIRIRAIDEHGHRKRVVLKPNKPNLRQKGAFYPGTSSACELICAIMARELDLNVPDYAIVNVPRDFAETTRQTDKLAGDILLKNIGKNFGSIFDKSLVNWNAGDNNNAQEVINQLEDILTFDVIIMNPDRRKGNPNLMSYGNQLVLIDHALAFIHILLNQKIIPQNLVHNHYATEYLKHKRCSYSRILDKWRDRIDSQKLSEIREMLPCSWQINKSDIDKIFEFLKNRHLNFIEISNRLKEDLS